VRTFSPKATEITRAWHVIDANDIPLGRIASAAATILRGKHKAIFAPHVDTGDFVIVINAGKVSLSGSKRQQKKAFTYSGYDKLLETNPQRAIEIAVKGMLPHNKLGRQLIKKLKVYADANHPHVAQDPKPYEIKQIKQIAN
jgi:large subunit ribosomal protein L13